MAIYYIFYVVIWYMFPHFGMYKKNLATLSGAVEEKKKFFPDTRKS
jgi:hypothetical protein